MIRGGTPGCLTLRALAVVALMPDGIAAQEPARPFVVTDTSVREGRFEAVAMSRDTIVSNFPRAAREAHFRFSINGLDNEFAPGTDHTIFLRPSGGRQLTPLYRFGVESAPAPPTPEQSASSEEGTAQVTFRLDMRHVLASLRDSGHYDPPLGPRISRGDPLAVYVRGTPEPLTWDLQALRPGSPLEMKDPDGDGVYEVTVPIAAEYTRPSTADGRAIWARRLDLRSLPDVRSSQLLQDALFRLSLEELLQLVRDDGALSAGAKWPGVWTRDVALSVILSLAIIAPDATRKSLLAKVDSAGRIIQDTGTGGSWPVSTDRMVWALAAWELYAATGDRGWLRQAHDIVRRSAEADLHAARDEESGLFNGESSFLDWREQSYPRWMQPADIYRSQNLGTNAIHYAAYRALANMARALGEPESRSAARWDSVAQGVARGMTAHLWQPERGWYGQFRYGRIHLSLSPRAEGLGEALASIYGAASLEQRQALMRSAPIVPYGTPSFWPYIAGERLYHNAAIWPFVTAYWTWAAAEGGNTRAVQYGLDANSRAAALFLTNKENMVAATGHYEGTALNSDRQLWSVAGTLAGTLRLLLGMRLEPERAVFRPMVPPSYGGERTLRGLRYRQAVLDITVRGHGDGVASVRLDGRDVPSAEIPATLSGRHSLDITLNGRWPGSDVNLVDNRFAPATPRAEHRGGMLAWPAVPDAVRYIVYRNARAIEHVTRNSARVTPMDGLDEYQVLAVNGVGDESFLSAPVRVAPADAEQVVKPGGALEREHAGFSGAGYLRLTRERSTRVDLPFTVGRDGWYALDVRYANGSGPVNTADKVAVRTLLVDGSEQGVVVMPQRGEDRWADWGWSNVHRVWLTAGAHTVTLTYGALDENMNRRENTALLDHLRVARLSGDAIPPRRQ